MIKTMKMTTSWTQRILALNEDIDLDRNELVLSKIINKDYSLTRPLT